MKLWIWTALLFFGAVTASPINSKCDDSYTDRLCGTDSSHLWIDIVVVVDNSKGMTSRGLAAVGAEISSFFPDEQGLGIQSEPRTTRIGVVTYGTGAKVVADLNKYKSVDDLQNYVTDDIGQVSGDTDSYLAAGLEAASDLLAQQSFDTDRDHYRKMVIVYASEYKGTGSNDPVHVADRLKGSTVTIATVAYNQDPSDAFLEKLSKISSPGLNFTNKQTNVVDRLKQAMQQVNCYCPNDWIQLRQDFSDEHSFLYGICLTAVTLPSVRTAAKISCQHQWQNSFLVNEYSQFKHDFVLQVVKNNTAFSPPYTYWIGLYYATGQWYWEQPSGVQPLPLQQQWVGWLPGQPTASSTKTAVVNQQQSSSNPDFTGWINVEKSITYNYVCEVISCDASNYCGPEQD